MLVVVVLCGIDSSVGVSGPLEEFWERPGLLAVLQLPEVGRSGRVPSQLSRPNRVLHKKANFASSKKSESFYATG